MSSSAALNHPNHYGGGAGGGTQSPRVASPRGISSPRANRGNALSRSRFAFRMLILYGLCVIVLVIVRPDLFHQLPHHKDAKHPFFLEQNNLVPNTALSKVARIGTSVNVSIQNQSDVLSVLNNLAVMKTKQSFFDKAAKLPLLNATTTKVGLKRTSKPGVNQDSSTKKRMKFPSHGCATGESIPGARYYSNRLYCRFHQLRIHAQNVRFQRLGGEDITKEGIRGQTEDVEWLQYQLGAFTVSDEYTRTTISDKSQFHYVQPILTALLLQTDSSCPVETNKPGVTLLIQRYEYVNLFHSMTDWWNTWLALDAVAADKQESATTFANRNTSIRVIFLDAHPAGALDDVWRVLFQEYHRLPHLLSNDPSLKSTSLSSSNKTICLESAVLLPAGYTTELYQAHANSDFPADRPTMQRFVDFVLDRYSLTDARMIPGRIVLIDRKPYLAHPRSKLEQNDRVIENLGSTVLTYLRDYFKANNRNDITIKVVQLELMSMKEQIRTMREAQIVVGYHGAGLTHVLFMEEHSHLVEFNQNGLNFFVQLAHWKEQVDHTFLPSVDGTLTQQYIDQHLIPTLDRILNTHSRAVRRSQKEHQYIQQPSNQVATLSLFSRTNAPSSHRRKIDTSVEDPISVVASSVSQVSSSVAVGTNLMSFPTHGCSVGVDIPGARYLSHRLYCRFSQLSIHAPKVVFQRYGGEDITKQGIRGQSEDVEWLQYQIGAFTVSQEYSIANVSDKSQFYYIQPILTALRQQHNSSCLEDERTTGTTLLIQRYEYVNLYHTMTDWWNTWSALDSIASEQHQSANSLVMKNSSTRVIFLDAHPAGSLDDVWRVLFQEYHRLPHLLAGDPTIVNDKTICLESAALIPAGYTSELYQAHAWPGLPPDVKSMQRFIEFFLDRYSLSEVHLIPGRIVLIDRQPYFAHPRSRLESNDRVIDNLASMVLDYLQDHFKATDINVTVKIVRLELLSMREQIQTFREAQIVVGNHGAGLTHVLFMQQHSHLLEIQQSYLNFFAQLAQWRELVGHTFLPSVSGSISPAYMKQHLIPAIERIFLNAKKLTRVA